jgi:hypothetical protein
MAEFPYTPVPNQLRKLLEQIPTIGVPDKATQKWLAGLGFTGGNNRRNLAVMREVGIIGSDGAPTELYKALRAKDRAKFAAGIRKHYADLFSTYSDAHRKDNEALIAFVRSKTDYAEGVVQLAVRTFKVLTEFGDFDKPGAPADTEPEPETKDGRGAKEERKRPLTPGSVGLTVNIQLQLPPSTDSDVYDKLFAAMAKHLKGLVTVE